MKALSGTLDGLVSTINGRNADIYGVAVDNGLNLSLYGNRAALYKAYTTQVDSRLSNVTASVFQTPTLTLNGTKGSVVYADSFVLAGSLQGSQTGLSDRRWNCAVITVLWRLCLRPRTGPTCISFPSSPSRRARILRPLDIRPTIPRKVRRSTSPLSRHR